MPASIDLEDLSRRENEQTEWKENVADVDDVVATLSAFANDLQNLGGGYVVCGVREEKDPYGFPRFARIGLTANRLREVENTVLARCRDRVSPPLAPLVEELPTEDPERRILVFVQPATTSAHSFRRGKEGARHYVRVSRSTLEARNGLLRDLLVRKGDLEPWDRRACQGATAADLDPFLLRSVLQQLGLTSPDLPPERFISDSVALSSFVPPLFTQEALTGILRPRNFAILLFGRETQRFIPGAITFFSKYDGQDRAAPRGQRLELAATLLDQLRQVLVAAEAEAITLYDKNDAKQPSVLKYPARAIREAVVNAFAHRDYQIIEPLRITAFNDHLEINSPGSLPFGITADAFTSGLAGPIWRNQSLAWFLSRLGYAETEGQGLRTIHTTLRQAGCPPPEFEANEIRVRCVLRAHPRANPAHG